MYLVIVYVPKNSVKVVKEGLFSFGCGQLGQYEHCCWSCEGIGQFRPLAKSLPAIGTIGALEKVEETRIEMIYSGNDIVGLKKKIKECHPYEEPAYAVVKME